MASSSGCCPTWDDTERSSADFTGTIARCLCNPLIPRREIDYAEKGGEREERSERSERGRARGDRNGPIAIAAVAGGSRTHASSNQASSSDVAPGGRNVAIATMAMQRAATARVNLKLTVLQQRKPLARDFFS
jgi:hypothetical protein